MEFINTAIIRHPLNWAIVIFMLIIAGFIVDILAGYVTQKDSTTVGAAE